MRSDPNTISPVEPQRVRTLYRIVSAYVFATYMAFAIHTVDILVIRFLRLPLLVFFILYTLRKANSELFLMADNMKWLKAMFGFLIFYMLCNAVAGLNYGNSLIYLFWLIAAFLFFFYLIRTTVSANTSDVIYTIGIGFFWPGILFIAESLIGGYVLNLPSYFDEGANFETGGTIKEFGGVFGNSNTLAMVVFVTFSSLLLVYAFRSKAGKSTWLIVLTLLFLLGLQVHVASRTGIFCTYVVALLYLLFYQKNMYAILLLFLPVVVYILINISTLADLFQLHQFEENKYGNRTELVDDAFRIVDLMDFFGVGYANQRSAREYYAVTQQFKERGELNFHNTYLALWVELGYLGLLLFILPILVVGVRSFLFSLKPYQRYSKQVRLLLITAFPTALFGFAEDSINMAGSPVFSFFWLNFILVVFLLDNTYTLDEKDSLF